MEGQGSSSISGKVGSPTSAQGDVNSAAAGDSEVRSELPSPLIEMVEKSAKEAKEPSALIKMVEKSAEEAKDPSGPAT